MTNKQTTLKQSFAIEGRGLHTGAMVKAVFLPAEANHGYKFKRVDIEGEPIIEALAENVVDTSRGTVIGSGDVRITTIEHALAALYASGIDNCMIELNGPEVPILEGSSKLFLEAIENSGIAELEAEANVFAVKSKIEYRDDAKGIHITILPDEEFSVNALLSFPNSKFLANQYATLDKLSDFKSEISCAKTFVFLHELEILLNAQLIKGGDLDNALVIIDKEIEQKEFDRLAQLFNKPSMEVMPTGVLNNTNLIFDNEPARHKILDIIGDLALTGVRLKGRIIATKPGHFVNNQLARKIRKEIKATEVACPVYDADAEPLYTINDIKRMLPHRPPFLLIDKILRIENKDTIIGIKNVTMNEAFFTGHFPNEPVMPGVLIVEAMAQGSGILVLSQVEDPENYSTYFLTINNVKFRRKVVPGDTLIFRLHLTTPLRRGIANIKAQAFVGKYLVTEAEFMAQIAKNK